MSHPINPRYIAAGKQAADQMMEAAFGRGAPQPAAGLLTAEVISFGPSAKLGMLARRSCLACHEEWGMHHRCPALGGRWNCC